VNSGIAPVQNLAIIRQVKQVVLTGDEGETVDGRGFCKYNVQKGLAALEKLAAPHYSAATNAVYLGGTSAPSIADICLVPQMYNANRFGVDLTQFPTLMSIKANCDAHSCFQVAKPEAQPDAVL
jgi:maleylpyruvate isomerase